MHTLSLPLLISSPLANPIHFFDFLINCMYFHGRIRQGLYSFEETATWDFERDVWGWERKVICLELKGGV